MSDRLSQIFHAVEILKELSLESLRLHEDLAQQGGSLYEYDHTGLLSLFGSEKAFRKGQEDARLMEKLGVESHVMTAHEVRDLARTSSLYARRTANYRKTPAQEEPVGRRRARYKRNDPRAGHGKIDDGSFVRKIHRAIGKHFERQ